MLDNLKPYFRKLCVLYRLNLQSSSHCCCSNNQRRSNWMDLLLIQLMNVLVNICLHLSGTSVVDIIDKWAMSAFMEIYLLIKFNSPLSSWWKQMQIEVPPANDPKLDRCIEVPLVHIPSNHLSPPYPRHAKLPEGERSAHWSSLESRNDSKFFSLPLPRSSMRWEILL